MCSFTAASIITTIVSTAVSVAAQAQSSSVQAKAQRNAAEYNAQLSANEAAVQEQNARNEMAKGIAERERQQRNAARQMGTMRAALGASGFAMDFGSGLSLLAESAEEHQYDSQTIMSNAAQAAWGHQVAANSALNNRGFAKYQAANANSGQGASLLNMGSTILGGIGQGIGQYNAWNKTRKPETGHLNRLPKPNAFSDDWGI